MDKEITFRTAQPADLDLLVEMTMLGLYHWGYEESFPELMAEFRQNNLPTADYIRTSMVFVMVEGQHPAGYFGLDSHQDEAFVDLRYFFLDTNYIGRGYGKIMWRAAVKEAAETGFGRMRIVSDPAAVGFYRAMGATLEKDHIVRLGFALGIMWYSLNNAPV